MSDSKPASEAQLRDLLERIEQARQHIWKPSVARPFDAGKLKLESNGDRLIICRRLAARFKYEWHELAEMSEIGIGELFVAEARNRALARKNMIENISFKSLDETPVNPNPAPADLIRLRRATEEFHVSEKTLRRNVEEGRLKDWRPSNHKPNTPLIFDRREVANLHTPRAK